MSRERLSFYLKYALRSLRRDAPRSLFAAFCVTVGVGAVVAMQSLGLVVTDTMSENVKAIVREEDKMPGIVQATGLKNDLSVDLTSFLDGRCYLLLPGTI